MGRGAEKETRRAIDQERARQDAINQMLLAERGQTRGQLVPEFQKILAQPGFSEQEKAAITGQSLGALGSAFDALQQRAENRLARTRNPAGYAELLDELARERGREASSLTRQNQIDFGNEAFRRQLAALQGLSSLYGVDTRLLGQGLGIPAELLAVRQRASSGGGGFRFGFGPLSFGFGG